MKVASAWYDYGKSAQNNITEWIAGNSNCKNALRNLLPELDHCAKSHGHGVYSTDTSIM